MVNWVNFWRFWGIGLLLFAGLVAMNPLLVTDAAPEGIGSHQAAATGAAINAIQQSWQAEDVLMLARIGMIGDLVFIGVFTTGGIIGGLLLRRRRSGLVAALGGVAVALYGVFGLLDYAETIPEIAQAAGLFGNDTLAAISSTVRAPKYAAGLAATLTTVIGLICYRFIAPGGPGDGGTTA